MVLKKQDKARAQIQKPAIRAAEKTAQKLQKHIVKNTVDRGGANEG